jgi:hypothetical protein
MFWKKEQPYRSEQPGEIIPVHFNVPIGAVPSSCSLNFLQNVQIVEVGHYPVGTGFLVLYFDSPPQAALTPYPPLGDYNLPRGWSTNGLSATTYKSLRFALNANRYQPWKLNMWTSAIYFENTSANAQSLQISVRL